ncbi:BON domain-containing protein [Pseudodesulfovibrio sp. F-1]|uniref:BON domain-containing protein n=1 Tax=Pseudodesulfovibrio alkaliphilus TaxID=2661613 RepID=A0A7K1KJT3_9BACT|nr:BON domain-containing protein [Pseudodesulfovibrio alkaliphilus]MUM76261.1 BON domain-containing protein [Pseudodesulfovibrio alkaliphilus]
MQHPRRTVPCLLLVALAFACAAWTPWGAVYGSIRDERSVADQAVDKKISLSIKKAMADRDAKKALKIHVYCFLRHVYLVGAIDDRDFRDFAADSARKTEGVDQVYTHLVNETDTLTDDLEIAARVRAALIAEKQLSSTQIETETMNGEVVMIGMVRSQADAQLAVRIARGVQGVRKVTSYLIPPR